MGLEGGTSLVRTIILVLISAILIITLAQIVTGKTEALGCSWADQLVSVFEPMYKIFGASSPAKVC